MRFSCEKALISSAVLTAARAVSSKSPIPVLEGLLLVAESNAVSVTGYNLETGIQTKINASIYKTGKLVVNSRIFCDIIRKLPDDIVTVELGDRQLITIKCGQSRFDIVGIKPDEFPDLPSVERKKSFSLPGTVLKDMINTTIFSVSENYNKPIHTGELFDIEDGFLTLVAVDGYRMSIRREKLQDYYENMSFVVPAGALRELERILESTEDPVFITFGGKHILFEIDGTTLVSRLLEGEFINYKSTVPEHGDINISVCRRDFLERIERVSLVISEKLKNAVRLQFGENSAVMTCVTAIGRSYDSCEIKGSGNGLEIGFNNRFLIDSLRSSPDEEVRFEMKGSLSPVVVRPLEGDSYTYMILPVRLKNEA